MVAASLIGLCKGKAFTFSEDAAIPEGRRMDPAVSPEYCKNFRRVIPIHFKPSLHELLINDAGGDVGIEMAAFWYTGVYYQKFYLSREEMTEVIKSHVTKSP